MGERSSISRYRIADNKIDRRRRSVLYIDMKLQLPPFNRRPECLSLWRRLVCCATLLIATTDEVVAYKTDMYTYLYAIDALIG